MAKSLERKQTRLEGVWLIMQAMGLQWNKVHRSRAVDSSSRLEVLIVRYPRSRRLSLHHSHRAWAELVNAGGKGQGMEWGDPDKEVHRRGWVGATTPCDEILNSNHPTNIHLK